MPEVRKDRATMWREYLVVWKVSYIELYEPYVSTFELLLQYHSLKFPPEDYTRKGMGHET